MCLEIVLLVLENGAPFTIYLDSVLRVRKVFRSQPEIDRALPHLVQHPHGDEWRGTWLEHVAVEFADHGDMSHRELPFAGGEIEVIDGHGFLENSRIRFQG